MLIQRNDLHFVRCHALHSLRSVVQQDSMQCHCVWGWQLEKKSWQAKAVPKPSKERQR